MKSKLQTNFALVSLIVSLLVSSFFSTTTIAFARQKYMIGNTKWLFLLCKFSDDTAEPKSREFFQALFQNEYPGLDHYWREASYNQISLDGSQALGWFTLPNPKSTYTKLTGTNEYFDFEKLANDCGNLADSAVNFPDFFGIAIFVNGRAEGTIYGQTRSGVQLNFDSVSKNYPVIWIDNKASYDLGIVIHEMAHGLGVKGHSYYYGLGREPGFGNRWNGALHCGWSARVAGFNCVPIHLISASKYEAGFIPESRVITIAPNDPVAQITLERLAQPQTSNPLMIKIPVIGSPDRYFTVEARQKIGYDNTPSMPGDAVLIHDVWPSYYLDGPGQTDSRKYGIPGEEGSMWLPGDVFSGTAGITVTIVSSSTTGFVVEVDNNSSFRPTNFIYLPNMSK